MISQKVPHRKHSPHRPKSQDICFIPTTTRKICWPFHSYGFILGKEIIYPVRTMWAAIVIHSHEVIYIFCCSKDCNVSENLLPISSTYESFIRNNMEIIAPIHIDSSIDHRSPIENSDILVYKRRFVSSATFPLYENLVIIR